MKVGRVARALGWLTLAISELAWGQAQEQVPPPAAPQAEAPVPAQQQGDANVRGRPAWELGLGIGAVSFRDYRGSDTTHAYPVVVPYFIYRGRVLRADRDGLKTKLLPQDRVRLDFSANATTPVRNSVARQGMPQLKTTVEAGPALDVHLWRSADAGVKFDLRLPVRAVTTLGSPGFIGWFFAPNVNVDIANPVGLSGWNLGVLTGPLFATSRYNQYYYSVAPQYATPGRPAYEASGGYAGTQVLAALTKRYPRFWTGAYVRHDSLSGASFERSPLVKSHNYWSAGIGIAWIIGHSSRLVDVPESLQSPDETCTGCSKH
jgi:outer membrane scaffolding protein for murein synthesis (MipA/OmpV family)